MLKCGCGFLPLGGVGWGGGGKEYYDTGCFHGEHVLGVFKGNFKTTFCHMNFGWFFFSFFFFFIYLTIPTLCTIYIS